MSESVSLPALGESVTEGTVTRWLKQVGDRVEVDEPLLEVSTDKVDTEIPSPVAGVIEEILVAEDETVEVGAALVRIGDGSGGGSQPADESGAEPATEVPAAGEPSEAPAESSPQDEQQTEQPQRDEQQDAQPQQDEQQDAQPQQDAQLQQDAQPQQGEQPQQQSQDGQSEQADQPQQDEQQPAQEAQAGQSQESDQQTDQSAPQANASEDAGAGTAAAAEVESAEIDAESSEQPQASDPADQPQASAPAEQPQTPAEQPQESAPASAPQQESASSEPADDGSHAGYVTPIVRKLAHEKGVDLSALTGTGVGGRIRKQDVLDAAEKASAPEPEETTSAEAPSQPQAVQVSELRGTTVPMSRLRKVVAERAVVSMQTSAQLTTVVEVDVTRVARYRDEVKSSFQEKTGTKLSFLPFFTLAAAEALKTYPIVNATIDGDSIVYPDHENISIAVDTERGLLTPVVRDASDLSLAELAQQIADLASRTRDNKLKPDELAGGTFTVTNTGSRGALFDTPLVFLPQVAILGTGIVVKKPVVVSDQGLDAIAIRSTVYLALSYDHRIVDGADAARFLTAVKDRLEGGDFAANLGI